MMPGLLEKFLGVEGLQLPPSHLLNHLLKWKKCLEGKLPQFSSSPENSTSGKPSPGSSEGMQTILQFAVCVHVPGICSPCPSEKEQSVEERKDK